MIAGSEAVLLVRLFWLRHERHPLLCRAAKRRAVWRGGMRLRKIDAEMCTATFLWPQRGDGDHQRDDRRISFRPIGIGQRQQRLRRFNQSIAVTQHTCCAQQERAHSGRIGQRQHITQFYDRLLAPSRLRTTQFRFSRCCGDRAQ